ncbi:hypothetical protein M231_02504 [Tremella mesenterica]|uniref:Uncharacterized protein n=1 Tax=Tremella mesenterica TaxID=5217 RepID=A0A4Q1BQR6_TREME|nr:uncharacterized protein TREMEDRAFT_64605 [Tremella mesenterica DSM 1558]EIW67354.1 hypothetical protein TREMEDRAFT_64605 [Tremella mesenterica DSM 1558]RXK40230.1 hypothetical protein M231_02504 [Tremella mesenterica]
MTEKPPTTKGKNREKTTTETIDSGTDPGDKEKKTRNRTDSYPISLNLWILEFVILILLGLVCFGSATTWAIVRDSKDGIYVGTLQSCTQSSCTYLTASTSSSSSSSPTLPGVDIPSLFLTLGLGCLAAFYMTMILFIFSFARFFRPPPSSTESNKWGHKFARYAYAVTRLYLGVEAILVFALACKASYVANQAKGAGSVGWAVVGSGLAALWVSSILLFFCWVLDYTAPNSKTHKFFINHDLLPYFKSCFGGCCGTGCCGMSCCGSSDNPVNAAERGQGGGSGGKDSNKGGGTRADASEDTMAHERRRRRKR